MSVNADAPDILKRIVARKIEVVEACRARVSQARLIEQAEQADPPRGFRAALEKCIAAGEPAVIAEIKKASPSKGVLREAFDPAWIAADYAAGGAACLSVLTEQAHFLGDDEHLKLARSACALPVIRKDFMVDDYQVYEARALGADCILLIVAVLDDAALARLHALAKDLGMDVLVEVHDAAELERALRIEGDLLGINNRDLRTFHTDIETCIELGQGVPAQQCLVAESGLHSAEQIAQIRAQGIHAFLVGEAFMRAESPGQKLAELFGLHR